jgi:hypothetical protein
MPLRAACPLACRRSRAALAALGVLALLVTAAAAQPSCSAADAGWVPERRPTRLSAPLRARAASASLLPALLLLLRCAAVAAGAPPPPPPRAPPPRAPPGAAPAAAINWASAALGATATANSAGYWVRRTAHSRAAAHTRVRGRCLAPRRRRVRWLAERR